MNVGIFTDTYIPQINGVATSVRMLERQLTKMGHRVFVFTTTNPEALRPLPRVFRLPSMPLVFLKSHRLALMYPPKLVTKMKVLNLDVIHTQTEFPLGIFGKIVADFYKIPHIHTYHTMYEEYVHYVAKGHLVTPKMVQQYSRIFCNRCEAVISPGVKTRDSLLEYGVHKPIKVIPTGIDFEPFSRDGVGVDEIEETKRSIGLTKDDRVIVYIGRVAKEKSIDVLIRSMPEVLKHVKNAKLVCVGDGPQREDYIELAASMGLSERVLFAGSRPWEMIARYYQMGEVFVSASTTETQGLVFIEAMASKTPVVARNDRCLEGIIEDGVSGYLFEREADCAKTLIKALSDPERNKRITEAAFLNIEHLPAPRFAENILALYRHCSVGSERERVFEAGL